MRRFCLLIVLLAFFLRLAGPLAAATPFAHAGSDLSPDPAVRYGALPNGLRYAIRANTEPKNRASLRLLVEAGSLHESEDQRGLAHFLEHMAFNGSEHYAAGTLVEFFQRMGMNFGGDTNANTGFDRTLYLLELPDTNETTLSEGFRVFADYAGGLLLRTEEIKKERGVILSEKRTSDSVEFRSALAEYEFMFGGTLFPVRFPIGETSVIEQAGRERFADFYDTWYRPERMSIVVVGQVDPEAVEKQIINSLAKLKSRAPARPQPDLGKLKGQAGTRTHYHYEPEAAATSVQIATVTPYTHELDTAANRLKLLPRELAHALISRRLSILAKKENAPFAEGSADAGESYNTFRTTGISLSCNSHQWEAALGVADQELRRALQHGFLETELREVVARQINGLEQDAKAAATRRSERIANEIAQQLLDRDVFITPQASLELYKPALEKITAADCLQALRSAWSQPHRIVTVTGNAKLGDAATASISAAYSRTSATAVTAPEAIADLQWAYTDFGPAGPVTKRDQINDLDVTLVRFANGVRLNLKQTDFEANRIRVNVRIGSGQLTEPKTQPGLAAYAGQTFTAGGLGRHSIDDLTRILAGKTVGVGFRPSGDAFALAGSTNRADLLLELQLITAQIVDPGYRPEAARQARKAIDEIYLSFEHTADGPYNLEVEKLLASGDHRFGLPPKAELLQRNLDEVRAWLTPELASGAIEIAIVGDLDLDATIAAVAQTFGALPKRADKPSLDELRKVSFPSTPISREFAITTEIPKADVRLYWPTTDSRDIRPARRLRLLADVLSDRLRIKIREELGDAYSPGAGSSSGDLYPGFGYILAGTSVEPAKTKKIGDVITQLADELAKNGVTGDELERAKKPVLTSLRESARTNDYWIGNVLARAQEKPEVLDWCRTRYVDNESITAAELSVLAKTYLGRDRASRVIVAPAAKP